MTRCFANLLTAGRSGALHPNPADSFLSPSIVKLLHSVPEFKLELPTERTAGGFATRCRVRRGEHICPRGGGGHERALGVLNGPDSQLIVAGGSAVLLIVAHRCSFLWARRAARGFGRRQIRTRTRATIGRRRDRATRGAANGRRGVSFEGNRRLAGRHRRAPGVGQDAILARTRRPLLRR
jgi:hypothetical protein